MLKLLASAKHRVRRWGLLVSFRSTITAIALIAAAVALAYQGVTSWQWPWLGNIFAALLVTAISAVVIDSVQIKRKRKQLGQSLLDAKKAVITAGDDLKSHLDRLLLWSESAAPHPPHWLPNGIIQSHDFDDYLPFWVARLRKALTVWTIHSGYGFGQSMIPTIETKLAELREEFSAMEGANRRLTEAMPYKGPRRITFADTDLTGELDTANEERAREEVKDAHAALVDAQQGVVSLVSQVQKNAEEFDTSAHLSRRVPPRLPLVMRITTGAISVGWIGVLGWSIAQPGKFPDGFLGDNLENIAADTVVSLAAGGIALLVLRARGARLTSHALASALQINITVNEIHAHIQSGSDGWRENLTRAASWIEDLTDALMSHRPSAELAIKSRECVTAMRTLAESPQAAHKSEEQLVEDLALLESPDDDAKASTEKAELREHLHSAMLGYSQLPREAMTDLVIQLQNFSSTAFEVAKGNR